MGKRRMQASSSRCTDHVVGTALALPQLVSNCRRVSAAGAGVWLSLGSWASRDGMNATLLEHLSRLPTPSPSHTIPSSRRPRSWGVWA